MIDYYGFQLCQWARWINTMYDEEETKEIDQLGWDKGFNFISKRGEITNSL